MIGAFMGSGAAPPANQGTSGSVGVEDNIPQAGQQAGQRKRQFLANLLGGGKGKGAGAGAGATGIAGLLGGGGDKVNGPPEARVAAAAGAGATGGMPTCADDGTVTMTLRQVSYPVFSSKPQLLTSFRSTKMVLVPSQPMLMVLRVALTRLLCNRPQSLKTSLVSEFRVSLLPPTPSLK
jgi:hypothetical protein